MIVVELLAHYEQLLHNDVVEIHILAHDAVKAVHKYLVVLALVELLDRCVL